MLLDGRFDVHPYLMEQLTWPGWMQNAAGLDHSRLTMFLCPPDWIKKPAPSRMILYCMHESSQLPEGWAEMCNTVERLIVPCDWVKTVYKESGVTVPISVVHPGIDFNEVPILPPVRKGTRPFTFMTLGDRGIRKGWDLAYSAFYRAFRKDDNVALIIKSNLNSNVPKIIQANYSSDSLMSKVRSWPERVDNIRDIFSQADCLVYPALGEGWGMFCREAAACGLPVIATNYSGMAVDLDQWAYPLNDWTLVPAPGDDLPGLWSHPNVDEIAERMRFIYEHQDEAREKGLQSARWLRQNATWEQSIQSLHDVFTGEDETRKQRLWELDHPSELRGRTPLTLNVLKEMQAAQNSVLHPNQKEQVNHAIRK